MCSILDPHKEGVPPRAPNPHADPSSALFLVQTSSCQGAAGNSEHQVLEAACPKALLVCRTPHSVLESGVTAQLTLRSQVLSE